MEPEVDPLDSQLHDNTYKTEENNDLSEERNLLDLQATGMKTEYVDHSYDLKSQIKDEDSSVPNIFPVMKCEVEEDLFDLDKVQQEQKEELSSEGDEVLTESVVDNEKTELPACESIVHEEKLAQCPSFRLDSTIGCDIIHSPIKCDICNEDFLSSQSLERHFRTHTLKKSFKCDVCGKSYTHTGSLKIHARLHTGEMPFECDVCRKSFRHLGHLKIHERIHTGERPFKCDMCGKSFPESGRLKKHVLIHTGERPFKCDMCGKCFSEKGSLMKHIRIHTGDRPFKCDMCGKGMGYRNTHPAPVEFKYRMKSYVMDKHSAAVFFTKRNVDERVEETCLVTDLKERSSHQEGANEDVLLEKELRLTISLESAAIDETTSDVTDIPEFCGSQIFNGDIASRKGLNFLAGYVAHRLRGKLPEFCEINSTKGNTWTDTLSRGDLTKASQNFVKAMIYAVADQTEHRYACPLSLSHSQHAKEIFALPCATPLMISAGVATAPTDHSSLARTTSIQMTPAMNAYIPRMSGSFTYLLTYWLLRNPLVHCRPHGALPERLDLHNIYVTLYVNRKPQFQVTQRLCALDVGLWRFVSPRDLCGYKGKSWDGVGWSSRVAQLLRALGALPERLDLHA
ncbi:hypothetical protein ANN_27559 [Periplaneta americana]|uniref:C2H2-type domain-containing protein n=1 Tax=Periplaneta americana TaxID=6978 RepID=A0ABQ8RW82_PERAM|nr:hypothetical protein ANN_27559 [Periplaneta americana]